MPRTHTRTHVHAQLIIFRLVGRPLGLPAGAMIVRVMSQSIPTGYIPPGNPWGLAQKTCPGGGRDLTFESCPGAENSTRTGILWKMKVNLKKSSVNQIFTGENKKQAEFLTFFEVYVFSQWNFCWSMGSFFGSAVTHTSQKF